MVLLEKNRVMELKNYDDFKSLKGGLDISFLESAIIALLDYLTKNQVSWLEGIELINDLIYLKKHDYSRLNKKSGELILSWIANNYDNSDFIEFWDYQDGDIKEKQIVDVLDLTLNTIAHISHNTDVLPFLRQRLQLAKTELETYELKEYLSYLKEYKQVERTKLADEILDTVLDRVDSYFEQDYAQKKSENLLCGLRETIVEKKSSYAIGWCLKSEKYMSSHKRTEFVGGGALFVSKHTDLIQMSGSAPFTDWEEWFELEIDQLELYWRLEITYSKQKIPTLKALLDCSTAELLKLRNDDAMIIFEEGDDGYYNLKVLKEDLDNSGIENELKKLRRKRS